MLLRILRMISLVLLLGLTNVIYANDGNTNNIKINNGKKMLVAPEAKRYEWYYNGIKLQANQKELRVLKEGEYVVRLTDDLGNTHETKIKVSVNKKGEILTSYTIYTIGDSTVQDYEEEKYPRKGWGQVLQYFFDDSVNVVNKGAGGTSALSFYRDLWEPIKTSLLPGDYVLIQFGINDANSDPLRHTDPFTTFQEYLTKFVEETQAKGAHPVLVATLRRNAWVNDSTVYDAYHDYPVATRQLASTLNVPLIDLDQMTKTLMESLGSDYIGPLWYMNLAPGEYPNYLGGNSDDVHFQEMGAIEMAKLVTETIEGYALDTNLNKLIGHIKERYPVNITTNFPEGGILTRNNELPSGLTVTVKGIINDGYALNNWQDTAGNVLTTENLYSFVMDTFPVTLYAELDDDPQFLDCAGKNYGTAYIDSCGECVGGNTGKIPCFTDFSDSTYQMKPLHSGLCVQDNSTVKQQRCADNNAQLWTFEKSEGGLYKIKNYGTGRYIYVANTNSLTDLTTNSTGSKWRIESNDDSIFYFSPNGNIDMHVNVVAGRTSPGERLLLWTRTSFDDQKFLITKKAPLDCNGDEYGTASIDVCGNCTGGNTGIDPITNEEDCPVNIEFAESFKKVTIYPNPFTDKTTIYLNDSPDTDINISIYSLQGKLVYKNDNIQGNQIILGSKWSKGIYLGKLWDGQKMNYFKIIKY